MRVTFISLEEVPGDRQSVGGERRPFWQMKHDSGGILNLRQSKLKLEARELSLRTRLATLAPSLLFRPIATQSLFIGTGSAAATSWLRTQGPCLWGFVFCAIALTLLALYVTLIRVILLQVAVASDFVLWLRNAWLSRDQSLLQLVFHPQV